MSCGGGGETADDSAPDPFKTPAAPPIANKTPLPPATSLDCPKGTQLTYANFGAAIMSRYCISCHSVVKSDGYRFGAPVDVDFDSAKDVQIWRAAIASKALGDAATMPPTGVIPKSEQTALTEWLNCGAPN